MSSISSAVRFALNDEHAMSQHTCPLRARACLAGCLVDVLASRNAHRGMNRDNDFRSRCTLNYFRTIVTSHASFHVAFPRGITCFADETESRTVGLRIILRKTRSYVPSHISGTPADNVAANVRNTAMKQDTRINDRKGIM